MGASTTAVDMLALGSFFCGEKREQDVELVIFYVNNLCYTNKKEFGTLDFFFHIRQMHLLEYWQCDQSRYLECCIYTVRASDVRLRGPSPNEPNANNATELRAPGPQVPELSSNTSTWKFETMS